MKRKWVALGIFVTACAAHAQGVVKIGVLTDMNGALSAIDGAGSVVAAKMAVEDFGGTVAGRKIEVISADHQNKSDIGAALATRWFDADGVDVIVDLPNSSVALAVTGVGKDRKKLTIVSGAGTADLTGKACSPTGIHWSWDTYGLANGTAKSVSAEVGPKKWFFITADYAFGHAMERDAAATVKTTGGEVVGAVRAPFGTADFSSFLLQAQSSKADIVALANAGSDVINNIKQAQEFGLTRDGKQRLVALYMAITDTHALGLPVAKGLLLTTGFYWDRDEPARAWSKRFFELHKAMPSMEQAGVYSSVTHYLKAVAAAKSTDASTVIAKMREMPINDFFAQGGKVREDGRMVHDLYLFQIKDPSESKYPWDYYKLVRVIPGDQAFRPLKPSDCPLITN